MTKWKSVNWLLMLKLASGASALCIASPMFQKLFLEAITLMKQSIKNDICFKFICFMFNILTALLVTQSIILLLGDVGCDADVDDDELDDDNDDDDNDDDDDGDNDNEGGAVGSEYQLGIGRFLQKPVPTFHTIITICDMSVINLIVIHHNLCF